MDFYPSHCSAPGPPGGGSSLVRCEDAKSAVSGLDAERWSGGARCCSGYNCAGR